VAAILRPWHLLVATVALWPLLVDVRRSARLVLSAVGSPEGAVGWFASLPPYPFLVTVLAVSGLVWAWRAVLQPRGVDPLPRDPTGRLTWVWAFVIVSGTVIGLAALNPVLTGAFWTVLAADKWSWPMAPDLDSLYPLRSGRAALIVLLFFAQVRASFDRPERWARVRQALLFSAGLVAAVAVLQFLLPTVLPIENPTWQRDHRVTGLLPDPNACGSLLCAALLLLLPRGPNPSTRAKDHVIRLTLALLLASALMMTGSRVAWLATPLVALGWLLWHGRGRPEIRKPVRSSLAWAVLLPVGFWMILLAWPSDPTSDPSANPFLRRVDDTLNWVGGASETEMRSGLAGRRHHWKTSVSMIVEKPWWGQGIGTVRALYSEHRDPDNPHHHENAHSQPLQTAAESGLVGLAALAILIYLALRRSSRRERDTDPRAAPRLALVGFTLTSLTGHPLVLPELQLVLWLLIALSTGMPGGGTRDSLFSRGLLAFALGAFALASGVLRVAGDLARSGDEPITFGLHEVFARDADGMEYIWTRRRAQIALEVEQPLLLLPIRAGHPDLTPEHPVEVVFRVGDRSVATHALRNHDWHFWVLDLGAWVGETVTLVLEVDRQWSPAAQGSPDHRNLAVRLGRWEWLGPTLEPEPPRVTDNR
jgi:O-antigen ligase